MRSWGHVEKILQIICQTSELCYLQIEKQIKSNKVCSAEKDTKRSSVLLLRLVSFSTEQTLVTNEINLPREITVKIYIVSI